jgi:O-antigen ligase
MANTATVQTQVSQPSWIASRGLPVVLAVVIATAMVQPRALPVPIGLLALTLAGLALLWRDRLTFGLPNAKRDPPNEMGSTLLTRLWATQPATIAFLAFAAYCAMTALWSPVPAAALGKVSWLFLLVLMAAVGVRLLTTFDEQLRTRCLMAVAIAALLGSVFIAIEVWSNAAIMRFVYNTVPFMKPVPNKHVTINQGIVARIGSYVMNRNLGALNVLLWPAILCLVALGHRGVGFTKQHTTKQHMAIAATVLFAITLIATLPSEHESSQIAIVVSAVVFLLARWRLPVARNVVLAGWIAAAFGMLPVVMMAHKSELHRHRSIPETGQARIILWNFTANKFLDRPILGVGANATKTIDEDLKPTAKKETGTPYAERTGQHSHNIFVQTWFELGAIGALLYFAAGFMLWQAIGRLHPPAQPFAMAASTSAMCMAALTWGLWQEWYLSLFALAILLTALGNSALEGREHEKA